MIFQCGKYKVELTTESDDGEYFLEITATHPDGGVSMVNNVNGIMGEILSEEQIESGMFDDPPWMFALKRDRWFAAENAKALFMSNPTGVEKCLDADYEDGGWGFPSTEGDK